MKIFLIAILVLTGADAVQAAEKSTRGEESKIYKRTDESGHTVFSDEASEGAEEIEVREPVTFSPDAMTRRYQQLNRSADEDTDDKDISYDRLAITEPANDQTIRSNPGNFQVNFEVSPIPRENHTLQLLLDGEVFRQIAPPGPIQLTNVDRGTHKLQLQIVTRNNEVVQTSPAVTMHLLRHSILHPQGRKSQ